MKNKIFDIDLDRCVGCYACVVACMDQNDIVPKSDIGTDNTDFMWRDVTSLSYKAKIQHVSLACMHCDDAPCAIACPTGAVFKDVESCFVEYKKSLCIGCHSCVMACPFGAPKFDDDGKMEKCTGCAIRVENGLVPTCVRICPTRALKFDTVENIEKGKKLRTLKKAMKYPG